MLHPHVRYYLMRESESESRFWRGQIAKMLCMLEVEIHWGWGCFFCCVVVCGAVEI